MDAAVSRDELFAKYYGFMLAWCRRHASRGLGEPEDIVHTAYLRCHAGGRNRSPKVRFPAAYLLQLLRWVVLDELRSRLRRRTVCGVVDPHRRHPLRNLPLEEQIAGEALTALRGMPRRICLELLSGKDKRRVIADLRLSANAYAVHLCRAKATITTYFHDAR